MLWNNLNSLNMVLILYQPLNFMCCEMRCLINHQHNAFASNITSSNSSCRNTNTISTYQQCHSQNYSYSLHIFPITIFTIITHHHQSRHHIATSQLAITILKLTAFSNTKFPAVDCSPPVETWKSRYNLNRSG